MKGSLCIQDQSGHEIIEWDTDVKNGPLDPEVAEQKFNQMVQRGAFAFATIEGENVQTKVFNPHTMKKVTLVPAFQGG